VPVTDENARFLMVYPKHIINWLHAVEAQDERMRTSFKDNRPERWTEPLLYVYSVRNLLRACYACQRHYDEPGATPFADAIKTFAVHVFGGNANPTAKQLRDLRDVLMHFDKAEETEDGLIVYLTSDGELDEMTDPSLRVNDMSLNIDAATAASKSLARTCLKLLSELARRAGSGVVWVSG
jgi:hypothetical protein